MSNPSWPKIKRSNYESRVDRIKRVAVENMEIGITENMKQFDRINRAASAPTEVQLTVVGYEWTCPVCDCVNTCEHSGANVRCDQCGMQFNTYL